MLNSTFMLSLRAAAAGSTAILAAVAAQPAFAQSETKSPAAAPPMVGDVKTQAKQFAKEPTDSSRATAIAAAAAARGNNAGGAAIPRVQQEAALFLAGDLFANPVYDVAADGSVWARGRTYKAHFAADGFTYVPFLGGSAPRNFPVTFSIDSIEVAGQPMALAQPIVKRDGNRVTIDRGGVVETYELTADSVEQLFVFNGKPGSGEARIHLNVQSEMSGSRQGDKLSFANEFGMVSYTDAVAVDAAAERTSAPTQLIDGRKIEISVPGSVMAGAKYPLTIDPVLSTFTLNAPQGTGAFDGRPDVAFDLVTGKWMMAWEENFSAADGDIYTVLCDASGAPVAGTVAAINSDTANARRPAMANNRQFAECFVAYEKGDAPTRKIFGRSRSSTANTVYSDIQISENTFSGDHHNADVGGDPNPLGAVYYCVTWQRDFSATDTDILARLIDVGADSTHGGTIGIANSSSTLDSTPAISNTDGPTVAQDQDWVIVWDHQASPTDHDIFAAQVHWDGVVSQPIYPIDNSGTDDRRPTVSTKQMFSGNYLVAYEENGQFIYGRLYSGTTLLTGNNLTALEGVTPNEHAWAPSLDANDGKFVMSYLQNIPGWVDSDIFVTTFCAQNNVLKPAETHRRLVATTANEEQVRVASAFASGASTSNRDTVSVWTRRINGSYGEVGGAKYVAPSNCCRTDIAPAGGDGQTNVADLLLVITQWGNGINAPADINGDAVVNVADLLAVITAWGNCQ